MKACTRTHTHIHKQVNSNDKEQYLQFLRLSKLPKKRGKIYRSEEKEIDLIFIKRMGRKFIKEIFSIKQKMVWSFTEREMVGIPGYSKTFEYRYRWPLAQNGWTCTHLVSLALLEPCNPLDIKPKSFRLLDPILSLTKFLTVRYYLIIPPQFCFSSFLCVPTVPCSFIIGHNVLHRLSVSPSGVRDSTEQD